MGDFLFEKIFTEEKNIQIYSEKSECGFVDEKVYWELPFLQIPEVNSGFSPVWWYGKKNLREYKASKSGCFVEPTADILPQDLAMRSLPLWYKVDVPQCGQYLTTIAIKAEKSVEEVLLFLGRRRLAWKGNMQLGESQNICATIDVSPIIPRGSTERKEDNSVDITIFGDGICLQSIKVEAVDCQKIFIMADSTVADQSTEIPYAPATSYCGWGQMLPAFLPKEFSVSNHAHSGLTTESFRSEGHYEIMCELIEQGDICLIQFGHNDQKLPNLKAEEGYTTLLKNYCKELREKGVLPVLVTPMARNSWRADGEYNDLLSGYAKACIDLGKSIDVSVVDLHALSMAEIKETGLEESKKWFYPSDYTHTNDFGAYLMAGKVFSELVKLKVISTKNLSKEDYFWHVHPPYTTLQPPENCEILPPIVDEDFLTDFCKENPEDMLTRVGLLELAIRTMNFFPMNVYNDLYKDVAGHETFAGTIQCAKQNNLIPPVFTFDGNIYPEKEVTLEEALTVLMPAYASRRKLKSASRTPLGVAPYAEDAARMAVGEGLVLKTEEWSGTITRKKGADLCRKVHI